MKSIILKRAYSDIAGLMLAILTLGKTEANAIYVDSYFTNITIPPYISGTYAPVGIKDKNTDSAVHLRLTSASHNVYVQVWGFPNNSWSGGVNCTLNANGDFTTNIIVMPGVVYMLNNHVYEQGYSFAGLKMISTSQYHSTTISGQWYPDGTY